ncbi:MAG: response regulator, partial [Magnetococcales bacterium]|nr:response regulator [Magnetococcales bacterium]
MITYWVIDNSVSQNAFLTMQKNLEQRFYAFQAFHTNAKQAILFTTDCPTFSEYFSLPESNLTSAKLHDPIAFTEQQNALRRKLEKLSDTLQDHFPVVETCLIDRLGREHFRKTLHQQAEKLDRHEDHLSFFQKSLQLGAKETLTTPLYFSPDYLDWVIAYTSPVIMPDQTVPAFFHFEIPLTTFQELITKNANGPDRYLLVDATGLILADSAQKKSKKPSDPKKAAEEYRLIDDFPNMNSLSQDPDFSKIMEAIKTGDAHQNHFQQNGVTYHLASQSLDFLDWRIALIKADDHLLEGNLSFNQVLAIITLTPLLILLLGMMSAEMLARSLAKPIQLLFEATQAIAHGNLTVSIPIHGNDETAQLTASFNQMIQDLDVNKRRLIRSKRHNEMILNSMRDVFMLLSMDGMIQEINHPEPLGLTRKAIIGQPASHFFKQADFMSQIQGNAMRNIPNHLLTGKGDEIPILLSATLITDEKGEASAILLIAHDITEYQKAQELILEKNAQLLIMEKAANRAKSDFVANLSHEIRTPMNAILCLTDLALRIGPNPETRDYLSKIDTASHSLMGCLNDVLDFSKIEAGKLDLYPVLFNPAELFNKLAEMFGSQAANKGVELIFSIPEDYFQTLFGDSKRLEQVLTNLLRNAIKFTTQGTVIVKVHPQRKIIGPVTLQFSVQDTGIGIDPGRINQLFTPFTQADSSIALQYGGTGLGLNICKQLVEMMGGRIWAESIQGKGSEFYFTVNFEYHSETNKTLFVPKCLQGIKILVADDHEMTREIMEEILRGFKFTTNSVDSGEAALDELLSAQATGSPYHLIFLDWRMSGMDGIQTVQKIHQKFSGVANVPKIIMLTAFGKYTIQKSAEQSGVNLFIHKPVTRVNLFNAILEVFGERVMKDQHDDVAVLNEELEASMKIGGAHVLLAEDNAINQLVASELLERVGVKVDIVNNGQEAIERLESASFDAVLMDVQMPVLDGHAATRAIRQNPKFASLPIIAMTAHVLESAREESLASGMNDHLTKPIDIRQLYKTLIHWINPDGTNMNFGRPPSGVTRTVHATGILPPVMEGIDIQNALVRLGGQEGFLKSMLLRFKEHAGIGNQIQVALQRDDFGAARNLAHMMAGIAGNLSAIRLQKAAHEVEVAIEQNVIQQESFLLTEFDQALRQ